MFFPHLNRGLNFIFFIHKTKKKIKNFTKYKMTSYEIEEILLPDFSTAPNLPHDLNAPFVVYNLRFNGSAYPEYPGHYVCRILVY